MTTLTITPRLSDTASCLLAHCAEFPERDDLRLILADALEECGGVVVCAGGCSHWNRPGYVPESVPGSKKWRPCLTCSGSGRVPDAMAAWSQYIRAAVELAGNPAAPVVEYHERVGPYSPDWDNALLDGDDQSPYYRARDLRRLTSSLLAAHGREWVRGPRCENCLTGVKLSHNGKYTVNCPACDGKRITGPLARVPFEAIGWDRGLPCSVRAPLAEWGREEVPMHPDNRVWLPSPWALAVCEQWPVTRLHVSDRPARRNVDSSLWYAWPMNDDANTSFWAGQFMQPNGIVGRKSATEANDALAAILASLTRAAIERERARGLEKQVAGA